MINSVHKAALLLKALSDRYPESISLHELSEETEIEKSTCVHILNTLIADSLAERTAYAQYCLGAGCFHLTRWGKFDQERADICRPVLQWLRDQTGETALIAEIRNSEKYTVEYVLGSYQLGNTGSILLDDIYRTATGRLLVSHLSDDALYDLVQRHGLPTAPEWVTITTMDSFKKVLQKIRSKSWISVENEFATGYAAPLYDGKAVFGAIGLAAEKNTSTAVSQELLVQQLLQAAQEINRRLAF